MQVHKVDRGGLLEKQLIEYAQNCSWIAGEHLALLLPENRMTEWETAFVLLDRNDVFGFCTLLKTDDYPENRCFPWISTILVDERKHGQRLSGKPIAVACVYAKENGFTKAYIPSDMIGIYEKYGFEKIVILINDGGEMDPIFAKDVRMAMNEQRPACGCTRGVQTVDLPYGRCRRGVPL